MKLKTTNKEDEDRDKEEVNVTTEDEIRIAKNFYRGTLKMPMLMQR